MKHYCNAIRCTGEAYATMKGEDGRMWRFCRSHVDLILSKLVNNHWAPLAEILHGTNTRAT